jgi:SAM-dependent methyltransferase
VAPTSEFDEPRLVAVYDTLNGYSPGTQPDFYPELARDLDAVTVIEIGCGTGLVTARFVLAGFDVIGLDPSELMLQVARGRPEARRARWIHGTVAALDVQDADLAFMAGHVAQFFLTDQTWHQALTAIHAALRPGGRLAFETRNPVVRAWEAWTPDFTRRTVLDPVFGEIETWTEVEDVSNGVVVTVHHCRFATTQQELTAQTALRFRTAEEVDQSLLDAGFVTEHRYGGWDRRPFTGQNDEIVVVASVPVS